MKNNQTNLRIIIVGVLILVIAAGLSYWGLSRQDTRSAEQTVAKALELRKNYEKNKDELSRYFAKEYMSAEKESKSSTATVAYHLSTRKELGKTIVTMSIPSVDEKGQKDIPVADFYLNDGGTIFKRNYIISDIIDLDPTLSSSIANILKKKTTREYTLDKKIEIDKSMAFKIDNFKVDKVQTGLQSQTISFDLTLDSSYRPKRTLVFSVKDANGSECIAKSKIDVDFQAQSRQSVKLQSAFVECVPDKLFIEGTDDVIVKLNG